ncbi:MAG: FGGY family carbohydrate kinase, partial [Desulfobacterales bacterium]|nr:FGGY family carbohydrate kinase [Desulfobacterales bacterium]
MPSLLTQTAPFFVGVDLGTGSCKSVLVEENGKILGFGVGGYDGGKARHRWQEQDPRDLLRAVVVSVRGALEESGVNPAACGGMSIGGALHSMMAVDG